MSEYVFPAPKQPSVAVVGTSARFPVRRIFCVGRNYAAHAREMGQDPSKEPPFFFTKPADAVVDASPSDDARIPYPSETKNCHHEIELVVALKSGGVDLDPAHALEHVFGYATGLDLTRRDLQFAARDAGKPWDVGKAFDRSAPIAAIHPVGPGSGAHPTTGRVWLEVNGVVKQDGNLDELIWSVPQLLATISRFMELEAGDLVFTGTPAGVGPIVKGDVVRGGVAGLGDVAITVT